MSGGERRETNFMLFVDDGVEEMCNLSGQKAEGRKKEEVRGMKIL